MTEDHDDLARELAQKCLARAEEIDCFLRKRKKIRRIIRMVNFVVSISALAFQAYIFFLPNNSQGIPFAVSTTFHICTAAVLLFSACYYIHVGGDTPERMEDYVRYLRGHSEAIQRALSNPHECKEMRFGRLHELIRISQWNLRDMSDTGFRYPVA